MAGLSFFEVSALRRAAVPCLVGHGVPLVFCRHAFRTNLIPGLSGRGKDGLFASYALPPLDRHIDILWIKLDRARMTTCAFRRDQDRAAAGERIENDALPMTAVTDGVGNETDRFDRRVESEQLVPLTLECVDTGIAPDVGPIAAMLT